MFGIFIAGITRATRSQVYLAHNLAEIPFTTQEMSVAMSC